MEENVKMGRCGEDHCSSHRSEKKCSKMKTPELLVSVSANENWEKSCFPDT